MYGCRARRRVVCGLCMFIMGADGLPWWSSRQVLSTIFWCEECLNECAYLCAASRPISVARVLFFTRYGHLQVGDNSCDATQTVLNPSVSEIGNLSNNSKLLCITVSTLFSILLLPILEGWKPELFICPLSVYPLTFTYGQCPHAARVGASINQLS